MDPTRSVDEVTSTTDPPLSLREYGRRRGCSVEAVRRAIQSGRLSRSLVLVKGKPKIRDQAEADREWEENTRKPEGLVPPPPDPAAPDEEISYAEARRRLMVEQWRRERARREGDELDLAERKGELVSVDEARATVIARFTEVRTKLLGVPTRVRQRLPHLTADDVLVIDDVIREALEELVIDDGAPAEEAEDGAP